MTDGSSLNSESKMEPPRKPSVISEKGHPAKKLVKAAVQIVMKQSKKEKELQIEVTQIAKNKVSGPTSI